MLQSFFLQCKLTYKYIYTSSLQKNFLDNNLAISELRSLLSTFPSL
jgi:hypothetical protein